MKILKIFFIVFIMGYVIPAITSAVETGFIYPHDKTQFSVDKVRVIGNISEIDHASLKIKNSTGEVNLDITAQGDYFSHHIRLEDGLNTISLTDGSEVKDTLDILFNRDSTGSDTSEYLPYYTHSDNDITEDCTQCHTDMENNGPKKIQQKASCITSNCHAGFDKGKFTHGPFAAGVCITCHNPHGTENINFLTFSGGTLCFTCHADAEQMINEDFNVHFPVLKRDCTACHDPHKSDLEYHLKRNSIAELCGGCHEEGPSSHKNMHTPFKSGDCTVCHKPHISKYKWLLEEEGSRLCISCHTLRKEEFNRKYVHDPVSKDCSVCHDPHGSETIYHLRDSQDDERGHVHVEEPFKELCLGCHRKLNPEIANRIDNAKYRHDPVIKGKCTICHTPHSTDYEKQLKAPLSELCYSCHKKMEKLIANSTYMHGAIHSNNCAQCHQPHGSDNRQILRANFSDKYADSFNMDNYALCFNCHNSKLVLYDRTVNTDFRNGSKNLHFLHVNRGKNGRSCKTCHAIHASNQEKHMRDKIPFKGTFTISLTYTKTPTGGSCVVGCHKPRKYDRNSPVKN